MNGLLLKALAFACFATPVSAQEYKAEFWLGQAELACNEIENEASADRVFTRLHAVYLQWGEVAKAEKITPRIKDPDQRARSHIAIAKHYAESENLNKCKLALNQARPLVSNSILRDELVEAYLKFANSPTQAIWFITAEHDTPKARLGLCEALARHGFLDEALEMVENELDKRTQSTLKIRIALAAAKAARMGDTERAVRQLDMGKRTDHYKQSVWCALAKALYKNDDMESARKYAELVTDKYTIQTNRDIRRIKDDIPPDAPYVTRPRTDRGKNSLSELLQSGDAEKASQTVEANIADAVLNPIEESTGQFGPWNQSGQLAKLRLQYAPVAAMYRKAGNQDEANKLDRIVEDALQTIVEENTFMAVLEIGNLLRVQVRMDDIDGLKLVTAATDPRIWQVSVDPVVSKVFSSGDIDGAKNIARRALAVEARFDGLSESDPSEIIACFIESGETEIAHQLVKGSHPAELTANACEQAGRAMIKSDHGTMLQTSKWRDDIGPFQRAYLTIGAAIMSRQSSDSD